MFTPDCSSRAMDKAGRLTAQDRSDQLGNVLKAQAKYCQ